MPLETPAVPLNDEQASRTTPERIYANLTDRDISVPTRNVERFDLEHEETIDPDLFTRVTESYPDPVDSLVEQVGQPVSHLEQIVHGMDKPELTEAARGITNTLAKLRDLEQKAA